MNTPQLQNPPSTKNTAFPVRIVRDPLNRSAFGLPPHLCQALGLAPGDRVALETPAGTVRTTVALIETDDHTCSLPAPYLNQLLLRHGDSLRVRSSGSRVLFGPFVGVFAHPYRGRSKRWGEQNTYFVRLAESGRRLGVFVYIVEAPGIRAGTHSAKGWVWSQGRWQKRRCPWPQVVYDRVLLLRRTPGCKAALAKLRRRRVPVFNSRAGDKWEQYRRFVRQPVLAKHVPRTAVLKGTTQLAAFLRRYPSVFVKPDSGTGGKGILRIRKSRGKGYTCDFAGRRTVRIRSLSDALARLKRGRRYIVQQAVSVLSVCGQPIDLRVLLQRDETGTWSLTGIAARLGRKHSPVANIHAGGRATTLSTLARHLPASIGGIDGLRQAAEALAVQAAGAYKRRQTCHGELGIDIVIDKNGQLWLLEVNPKPGRSVFRRSGQKRAAQVADARPLQFAAYLARFTLVHSDEPAFDFCEEPDPMAEEQEATDTPQDPDS